MTRQPIFDVRTQTALSGRELRTTWQTLPRYRYGLEFEFLRASDAQRELQNLGYFWACHCGPLESFRLVDPADCEVMNHRFALGDGKTTSFQLIRTLSHSLKDGSGQPCSTLFSESIQDVANVEIQINGIVQNTNRYVILEGGRVEFVEPPAAFAVVSWSGGYFRRVRFASEMEFERIVTGLWRSGRIEFVSVAK